ncbi:MAG: hypothetical protein A2Y38_06960, partial [Spirochaetes bacterium GWB1_59_5]
RAHFELRLPLFSLDVDFDAELNTTILWGESGAGKTSILDCIAGLSMPYSGCIELNGQLVFSSERGINIPPRDRRIGYVFQDYALFPHLSAEGNITLALPSRQHHRAMEYLERFGLSSLRARRPHELSGGERQRLALARALAVEPQLLLLDEPFSALDHATKAVAYREFLSFRDELNIGTILVTHSKSEADLLGQSVIEIGERQNSRGASARIAVAVKEIP